MKSSEDKRGYKNPRIYQLAHDLAIRIHKMSLNLPKFEMFEECSQIRRSSKSVSTNIVEGYALRRYKQEYIRYLKRALGSSLETAEHLEFLLETGSLTDKTLGNTSLEKYEGLNSMLYRFVESVVSQHDIIRVGKIKR